MVSALFRSNVSLWFRIVLIVLGIAAWLAARAQAGEPVVRTVNAVTQEQDRDRRVRAALALSLAEAAEAKPVEVKIVAELAVALDWSLCPAEGPCPCSEGCKCCPKECPGRCPAGIPSPTPPLPPPEAIPEKMPAKPEPPSETVYMESRDASGRLYYVPTNGDRARAIYPATGFLLYPGSQCANGTCQYGTCSNGRCGR